MILYPAPEGAQIAPAAALGDDAPSGGACAGNAQTPPRGTQSDRRSDPEVFVDSRACPVFTRINFVLSSPQASSSIPFCCCCSVKQKWVSARVFGAGAREKRRESSFDEFAATEKRSTAAPDWVTGSGKMAARDLQQNAITSVSRVFVRSTLVAPYHPRATKLPDIATNVRTSSSPS